MSAGGEARARRCANPAEHSRGPTKAWRPGGEAREPRGAAPEHARTCGREAPPPAPLLAAWPRVTSRRPTAAPSSGHAQRSAGGWRAPRQHPRIAPHRGGAEDRRRGCAGRAALNPSSCRPPPGLRSRLGPHPGCRRLSSLPVAPPGDGQGPSDLFRGERPGRRHLGPGSVAHRCHRHELRSVRAQHSRWREYGVPLGLMQKRLSLEHRPSDWV